MAFELHKIESRSQRLPATVRLRRCKNGVICYLSVSGDAVKGIGGNDKSSFDILIGKAEDAGKLRLRVNKDGKVKARRLLRTGWLCFILGVVGDFPQSEVDKQRCAAKVVEKDTLEVTLPDWKALIEDDVQPAKGGGKQAPVPALRPPAPPNPAARFSRNGIAIDPTIDSESVTFRKKTMDLTTRQAAVLAALLRAMPSSIGRSWLCSKPLADVPTDMREAMLDLIFSDLGIALPGIGLELKITKGVGAALAIKGT